jgi:hypothetical protein
MHSKRIITGSNSNFTVDTFVGRYDTPMVRIATCGQKIDLTEKQFNELVELKIARDLGAPEVTAIANGDSHFELGVGVRWINTAKDFGDGF